MLRPCRRIPYSAQPGPRDMRRGETFDACVPLLYKFVGELFRTVVENVRDHAHLQRQEEVVFNTL
eukprot:10297020-Alexandrium_andersonii.AAC.1